MPKPDFHESLSRDEEIAFTVDRSFGFLFAVVFAVIGVLPLLFGHGARRWAFTVALLFFAVALVVPQLLRPLNVVWHRFGLLLHNIVNPVVMGAIFFLTVFPAGVIMKIIRRDTMKRKFDRSASTYWIERESPGTDPNSMRNQF